MTDKDRNLLVDTISKVTNKLKYYGVVDIKRVSFYRVALKYRDKIRDEDVDSQGVSLARKLDFLIKRIEIDCKEIKR
jgi:hypothetical protein